MRRRRRLGRVLAVNLAVFVVLLAGLNFLASLAIDGAQLYRRFVAPHDDRADLPSYAGDDRAERILGEFHQLETRYEPFVGWRRTEFRGETTTIGPDGNRVQPATTADPAGTVRFFGGSTMWGTGVADEDTIPALFNRLHPELRVVNHGESGFTSRQSLALLVNLVNQGAPMDLVVFYDGNNDVGSFCQEEVGINRHTRAQKLARLVEPLSKTRNFLTGSITELLTGKAVQKWLAGPGPHPTRCHVDPAYARRVAETLVNDWRIARAVAREGGAEFVAVLQPVASLGHARTDHLSAADRSPEKEQNVVYPIVRALLAEQGIDWAYDFTDVFDGDEYIYVDDCHANASGNRRVAERLDRIVGDRLREIVAARRAGGAGAGAAGVGTGAAGGAAADGPAGAPGRPEGAG